MMESSLVLDFGALVCEVLVVHVCEMLVVHVCEVLGVFVWL